MKYLGATDKITLTKIVIRVENFGYCDIWLVLMHVTFPFFMVIEGGCEQKPSHQSLLV